MHKGSQSEKHYMADSDTDKFDSKGDLISCCLVIRTMDLSQHEAPCNEQSAVAQRTVVSYFYGTGIKPARICYVRFFGFWPLGVNLRCNLGHLDDEGKTQGITTHEPPKKTSGGSQRPAHEGKQKINHYTRASQGGHER